MLQLGGAGARIVEVVLEPAIRFRRTRWEVVGDRVFVQTGWLSRDQRIAPLSRVQTVDTHRGAVMRLSEASGAPRSGFAPTRRRSRICRRSVGA